ncbi:copper transporter [Phycicoccus flavus]|uniref:Copper transporter n=1 Tax=Phycicoccus flavus TaxID=2502783 RepID=A0A8T6R2S6_9MICO|nr:copper transporter [Phycicoccus flavus]NHA67790.1 copper transporter [Phycicoccus flavus]
MIDFRYHIVSIVSIFLALAVGIVLGAGPLQGEIGSTLQGEIASLRDDKAELNSQVATGRTELEQRDAFLAAISPRVVAGALEGRTVAVVVLPGADASVGESVVTAVGDAGGRVASTTSVAADWVSTDPTVEAARNEAVQQAAATSGVDLSGAQGPPRDALLAELLTRSAPAGDSGPDDTTARAGLAVLADAGLLSEDAEQFTRGELVVVVSGAVSDGDEQARTAAAEAWVTLTRALDTRSRGAVLAADVGSESDGVSVLTTLRGDSDATASVSTVDDAADPMGTASVVFALREQDGGSSGQYGLAPGADAAFAPVPGT